MAEVGRRMNNIARGGEVLDVSAADATFTYETAGIYVGGAGILKVDMAGDSAGVVFTCPAGALLPISVTKVYTSGTTATLIVALF